MTFAPPVPTGDPGLPVDRCFPVEEVFGAMLPHGGLQRGRVVGCTGSAAMTLAIALATRSVVSGSWLAIVGVPMLGVEACAEMGLPLARVVHVDADARPAAWAERIGAAADGFDLVLTRPPAGAERMLRKVRTRLQARGVVLLVVGPSSSGVSCDVEFTTTSVEWAGVGEGTGRLVGRRAVVRCGGRRVPRPIERKLWLPGPDGRVIPVAEHGAGADGSAEESAGTTVEVPAVVELDRAG